MVIDSRQIRFVILMNTQLRRCFVRVLGFLTEKIQILFGFFDFQKKQVHSKRQNFKTWLQKNQIDNLLYPSFVRCNAMIL